jgi:hypothetical protein
MTMQALEPGRSWRTLWFRRREISPQVADGQARYWEHTLARLGIPGVTVLDVTEQPGGQRVRGRPGEDSPVTQDQLDAAAPRIAVSKRLAAGAVRFETPEGEPAAGFIMHVRTAPLAATGAEPPLARFLTCGGAVVELRRCTRAGRYHWECLGCGESDFGFELSPARRDANAHAARCRSMPQTEE